MPAVEIIDAITAAFDELAVLNNEGIGCLDVQLIAGAQRRPSGSVDFGINPLWTLGDGGVVAGAIPHTGIGRDEQGSHHHDDAGNSDG